MSTRKVERLVEQLGVESMSKSQVSRICQALDERVEAFRNRPLEGAYPYLWLDARIERVRDMGSGMVRQKALLVAYGVHHTGRREVIGLAVGEVESEAEWRAFLRSLVARGLAGVRLAISDAHPGLRAAIGQVLGAQWQRCAVHFISDMLGHVPKQAQPMVRSAHESWAEDAATALRRGADASYVNFLGDEGTDRVRAAYPGPTWDRLAEVKRRYDPDNVFRLNSQRSPDGAALSSNHEKRRNR